MDSCEIPEHFIVSLFENLKIADVKCLILRNYEGLPNFLGNDLDLLVDPAQDLIFKAVLNQTAKEIGYFLIQTKSRYRFHSYNIFDNIKTESKIIKIDIWFSITWKGLSWIDTDQIIKKSKLFRQFLIPNPGHEAALLLLKDMLQVDEIRPKYFERIPDLIKRNPEEFLSVLRLTFGSANAESLMHLSLAKDWIEIEDNVSFLRRRILVNSIKASPVDFLRDFSMFLWGHLKERINSRNGMLICLMGPDGAGKTTLAKEIRRILVPLFGKIEIRHGRFGIIPRLRELVPSFILYNSSELNHRDPDSNIPKDISRISQILYIAYYLFDFMLGHLQILKNRHRGDLLIFDRYFYDYAIQPGTASPDSKFFRFLIRIIPQPDLLLFFKASPELIHARKPELTEAEILRQNQVCHKLIEIIPESMTVLTDSDPAITIKYVTRKILERWQSLLKTTR